MSLRDAVTGRTRLINDTAAELERLLRQAADKVAGVLAGAPTDYQRWHLPTLRTEIGRVLDEIAPAAAAAADAGMLEAWMAAGAMVDDVIAAPRLAAALPQLDVGQLRAARAFTTEKIKGATIEAMDRINDQLVLTMSGTQTPFDTVQQVTQILGESTRRRATGIVRTELATAYSTANQARLAQWGETVPGLQKRWVKSGKVHPRAEHVAIHGQVRDVDKPFDLEGGAVKMMQPHDPEAPPRHRINCGCVAVPVVPGYARKAIDEKEREAQDDARRGRAALAAARGPAAATEPVPALPTPAAPAATLQIAKGLYAQAAAGGRHAGMLKQLDMQGPVQWRRAIDAHQRRLDAHLAKLAQPALAVPDWHQRSPLYQQGLRAKWQREVDDAREQIMIIEEHRNGKERSE